MYEVDIVDEPARRVVGLEHRGAYSAIGPTFGRLMQVVRDQGLQGEMMEFLGVYFDDPREVPEDELRSMAAVRVRDDLELPQGLTQARLAAGRHARVRVRGPYSGLPAAWQWIHREWLPGTAERDRGAPSFEIYANDPGSVAESDLLTLIYLPLA